MRPVKEASAAFEGRLYLGVSKGERAGHHQALQTREAFHDVLELNALSVACQRWMEARLSAQQI